MKTNKDKDFLTQKYIYLSIYLIKTSTFARSNTITLNILNDCHLEAHAFFEFV